MLLFLLRIAERTETVKCEPSSMDENEINGNISISNVSGGDSTINTNVNSHQWSISSFARGDADILVILSFILPCICVRTSLNYRNVH